MKADLKPFEHKMNKTIEVLGKELAAIRAGRANPGVLDRITVEYYGAPTPLNHVAVAFVVDVGDALDLLLVDHVGDLLDHLGLVDHVGNFRDDDTFAAAIAVWIGMFADWTLRAIVFSIRFHGRKWLNHHIID